MSHHTGWYKFHIQVTGNSNAESEPKMKTLFPKGKRGASESSKNSCRPWKMTL